MFIVNRKQHCRQSSVKTVAGEKFGEFGKFEVIHQSSAHPNYTFKKICANLIMTLHGYCKCVHHFSMHEIIRTDSCGLLNHMRRIDWFKGFSNVFYQQRKGEFIAIWQGCPFTNVHLCLDSPKFSLTKLLNSLICQSVRLPLFYAIHAVYHHDLIAVHCFISDQ